MKCSICGQKIGETFLKKRIGTVIKDEKGKKIDICFECQQKFPTKTELLEQMK